MFLVVTPSFNRAFAGWRLTVECDRREPEGDCPKLKQVMESAAS